MTKNSIFHNRTKYIESGHHFIRELVEKSEIELEFCKTEEQLTDIFLKANYGKKIYEVQKNAWSI